MNISWENLKDEYDVFIKPEPALHMFMMNKPEDNSIRLQGNGVAIVLNENGTWFFEDTSGG